jgi:hypothetical protein
MVFFFWSFTTGVIVERTFIAEFCSRTNDSGVCDGMHVMRARSYARTGDFYEELLARARIDYPDLKSEDVTIVIYGGTEHKGSMGIEFSVSGVIECPEGYNEIQELEFRP